MENIKKGKLLGISLVAVAVILAVGIGGYFMMNKYGWGKKNVSVVNYVIPGVPFYGKHNQKGDAAYVIGDSQSALMSILEYWDPGNNDAKKLNDYMMQMGGAVNQTQIKNYFSQKKGYRVSGVELKSVDDIKQFVNPDRKIPLFAFLPIDTDQPASIKYRPAVAIIGVKDNERRIVVHSYWFGNNYEISYDDLGKMIGGLPSGDKLSFIAIAPEDLKSKLKEISSRNVSPYPARTSVMTEGHEMLKNFAYAQGGWLLDDGKLGLPYASKVANDPKFESVFPPVFRMEIYSMIAGFSLETHNADNAFTYANKALDLDHDLNKPFNDFPGSEFPYGSNPDNIGVSPHPYATMGDTFYFVKNYEKAYENYKIALNLDKGIKRALLGIDQVKKLMDQQKQQGQSSSQASSQASSQSSSQSAN